MEESIRHINGCRVINSMAYRTFLDPDHESKHIYVLQVRPSFRIEVDGDVVGSVPGYTQKIYIDILNN